MSDQCNGDGLHARGQRGVGGHGHLRVEVQGSRFRVSGLGCRV